MPTKLTSVGNFREFDEMKGNFSVLILIILAGLLAFGFIQAATDHQPDQPTEQQP